jgi:hypothetical protein
VISTSAGRDDITPKRLRLPTPWLGDERGNAADWTTQLWVRCTGRRIDLGELPWLAGPVGNTTAIGRDYFEQLAAREGLVARPTDGGGLLPSLDALAGPGFDPALIHPEVRRFYEQTSAYELEAWAEWCGIFRPFGRLLALLFSRRLQQLNVPLSSLDVSLGTTSEVIQLVDPASGALRYTGWLRTLRATNHVLYAGSYSVARVPGFARPCVKVVFPLPNGNAQVFLMPDTAPDGSLAVTSRGRAFGEPGFYFTVHRRGRVWARYVRAMQERIRVYADGRAVRADHVMWLRGATFLRLHYRLRRRAGTDALAAEQA